MKLVPENINEAIKHLTPRSADEIRDKILSMSDSPEKIEQAEKYNVALSKEMIRKIIFGMANQFKSEQLELAKKHLTKKDLQTLGLKMKDDIWKIHTAEEYGIKLSDETLDKILKNMEPHELLHYAVNNIKTIPAKYTLMAIKKNPHNLRENVNMISSAFFIQNYDEGIKYILAKPNIWKIPNLLETAAHYNSKWVPKLISLLRLPKEVYTSRYNMPSEISNAVWSSIHNNNVKFVKLYVQHDLTDYSALAAQIINLFHQSRQPNIEKYKEMIHLIFSNLDVADVATSTYRKYLTKEQDWENSQYISWPHNKQLRMIIKLMKGADMSQKLIQPFLDELNGDKTKEPERPHHLNRKEMTVGNLISILKKYALNAHVVINYDPEESMTQSNDFQHIVDIEPIKDPDAGDFLNITTSDYKR